MLEFSFHLICWAHSFLSYKFKQVLFRLKVCTFWPLGFWIAGLFLGMLFFHLKIKQILGIFLKADLIFTQKQLKNSELIYSH